MKKVLLSSQMFYPDIAATSKVMTDLAVAIVESNYKIEVISQNRDYNNYKNIYKKTENYKRIKINRYSVPGLNKNSLFGRLLLSYLAEKNFEKEFKNKNVDLCISVSNPPNMALKAAILSNKKNIPFVFILHDLYPDVLVKTNKIKKGSFIEKKMRNISKKTFDLSTKIVVLGRDSKRYISDEYNVSKDKIEVITNWGPNGTSYKSNNFKKRNNLEGKFLILYSGNVGHTAEFKVIIDAIKKVKNEDKVVLIILGNGRSLKEVKDCSKGIENIKFMDFLPEKEYLSLLSEADAFFVSLKKGLFGNSVPSKTYYYLSAGKPLIGVLPENSEVDMAIKEDNLGVVCNDYSPETLLKKIKEVKNKEKYETMKENIEKIYKEKYIKDKVLKKYISFIEELI